MYLFSTEKLAQRDLFWWKSLSEMLIYFSTKTVCLIVHNRLLFLHRRS